MKADPPLPRLPPHTHTASLGEFHEELSWRDNEMSWPAQLHSFLREKKKKEKTHLLDKSENEKSSLPLPSLVKALF